MPSGPIPAQLRQPQQLSGATTQTGQHPALTAAIAAAANLAASKDSAVTRSPSRKTNPALAAAMAAAAQINAGFSKSL